MDKKVKEFTEKLKVLLAEHFRGDCTEICIKSSERVNISGGKYESKTTFVDFEIHGMVE